MSGWLQPGVLVWPALALIIFGAWGAWVWPGPFPSVLVPIGFFALVFLSAWQSSKDKPDGGSDA